jgi:hypothetical protein
VSANRGNTDPRRRILFDNLVIDVSKEISIAVAQF